MIETPVSETRPKTPTGEAVTGTIRLLATTDLHGHLLGHDYTTDRPQPGTGLAGIATLIDQARAEAEADHITTVLVDNGDTLQGTPLASMLAGQPVTKDNAIVACMNALKYDAVGVGNHDLDHGQDYLLDFARALEMPMVCSNISGRLREGVQASALIACKINDSQGGVAQLSMGVLSLLPPLTNVWNEHNLGGQTRIEGTVACLDRMIPELRAQGADLIVVLAHMGVGNKHATAGEDDGAMALTDVAGIDALITGHTHRRLPGVDYLDRPGVDAEAGKLGTLPAAMAGHGGSDLAVVDLHLTQDNAGWQVTRHESALRRNTPDTPAAPAIVALSAAAHAATVAALARPVAHVSAPLHNYFALLCPSGPARLLARAKARRVRDALAGTAHADLPLLASSAAHTSGGRAGPDHYLHIPAGPLLQRHIAGLDPYANQVLACLITGAELMGWLEHSARIFAQVAPGDPDQTLLNPGIPGFHFDTIFGVEYQIDPTQPATPGSGRIRNLTYAGSPVTPDQRMVIATNQFRAAGGGGFLATPHDSILLRKSALAPSDFAREVPLDKPDMWAPTPPWHFAPNLGVQATMLTNPAAVDYLEDIAHLSPEMLDITPSGFARLRVTL